MAWWWMCWLSTLPTHIHWRLWQAALLHLQGTRTSAWMELGHTRLPLVGIPSISETQQRSSWSVDVTASKLGSLESGQIQKFWANHPLKCIFIESTGSKFASKISRATRRKFSAFMKSALFRRTALLPPLKKNKKTEASNRNPFSCLLSRAWWALKQSARSLARQVAALEMLGAECILIWIPYLLVCTYASSYHVRTPPPPHTHSLSTHTRTHTHIILRPCKDFKKTNKQKSILGVEAGVSRWRLLSLPGFASRIMLPLQPLQEWRHVRLSRCEMWAQAVGEIHFLRLHRDDSETERPGALVAVTNSRRQPQSEELACNDNGFEEVIAGDNGAKHLFVAITWTTLYHFLLDGTPSAAICPRCNIHKWHGFAGNLTICLWEKVISLRLFSVPLSLDKGTKVSPDEDPSVRPRCPGTMCYLAWKLKEGLHNTLWAK